MKMFDFASWSSRDLAMNTLTGGGLNYEDVRLIECDGTSALGLFRRKKTGYRTKFMDALEDAATGNEYCIRVRVKLGVGCTVDTANIVIGVTDPFALTPAFFSSPVSVTKDEWGTIEFTHTIADDAYSSISVEQDKNDKTVAEEILVSEIKTELLHRAAREKGIVDTRRTLWLIGDSITCHYQKSALTRGWGMYIGDRLDDAKIKVCNMARAGFSTKSFAETDGLAIWTYVCRRMKAGDYLIVSLGINDHSSSFSFRRTSMEEYAENLAVFADEAHRKGVTMIFVTSTVTVESNPAVNFRRERAEAMMRVAAQKKAEGHDVTCLDLNAHMLAAIREIEDKEGYDRLVKTYFSEKKNEAGETVSDTTHHREAGSKWVASMIMELLSQTDCSLWNYRK